jgi:phage terminase large subunit
MSSLTQRSRALRVEVPRKLAPLLKPAWLKGAHGGRAGAKSHFFAEQLLLLCIKQPTRAACIREVQNSLRESVRQLLIDKIKKFAVEHLFHVLENEIRGPNGSLIIFKGMQAYNAVNIKSLEGFDVVWCEEAQTLSAISLRILLPTLRKNGCEVWFSWNPRHDTDPIDVLLRGPHKPANAIVVEINWSDNPFLPDVLRPQIEHDYAADPEMAEHVWGGGYEIISEGSYYARLIAAAVAQGRVGDYPYNPALPVQTSWDLGVDDYTAVWFWQVYETYVVVIDFFEVQNTGADEIIAAAMPEYTADARVRQAALDELGRAAYNKPGMGHNGGPPMHNYGDHLFPHDIKMREWGNGARDRVSVVRALGLVTARKGVAVNPADRIEASRQLLPICRFNNTSRVDAGIKRLRRYCRKLSHQGVYLGPAKDGNDHAADAFGEFAINCALAAPAEPVRRDVVVADMLRQPTYDDVLAEAFGDDE